jgi:hypothetical protein
MGKSSHKHDKLGNFKKKISQFNFYTQKNKKTILTINFGKFIINFIGRDHINWFNPTIFWCLSKSGSGFPTFYICHGHITDY